MIYLDTHAAILLWEGKANSFDRATRAAIDHEPDIRVSPIVELEMQFLWEIRRLKPTPEQILAILLADIGVTVCRRSFIDVVRESAAERWTRDPFDRMIVGHARLSEATLITLDRTIQQNYDRALG
jgi:PIN domain nuclease of toxin-antitoxin system